MSGEEYLSISEFAKRAGISVQAVYKRLDKDFKPWLKVENGKKRLSIKALAIATKEKTSTEVESSEALLRMVSMLEKQLEIKDRQIEELQERLKESHVLIDQSQHLHAAGLLEAKTEATESEPIEPKKKRWFWQR